MTEPETLAWRVARLEADLLRAERKIEELEKEADDRERTYWRSGVVFLGGIVLTLIGVIWANLGTIFPGR
jgi:hypothetical protein